MNAPIPVTLRGKRKGKIREYHSWTRPYGIHELCIHLAYLMTHDFRVITDIITPHLGIDMATRIKQDNRANIVNTDHPRREFRHINKALSMELLIALLLTWLDEADRVGGGCCVRNGLPNNYSPSGLADIIAKYPATEESPAFPIVTEVSIRRKIDTDFYYKQLDQTYRHALIEAEKPGDGPVYGLVINGGQIASSVILNACYRRFLNDNGLNRDSRIRVLPLYTLDFAKIMMKMAEDDTCGFNSGILSNVFEGLLADLREVKLPEERDWMVDRWLNIVNAAQAPELDLGEPPAEDKPDDDSKPK